MILLADSKSPDQTADAKANLALHCSHMPKDKFSHDMAHILHFKENSKLANTSKELHLWTSLTLVLLNRICPAFANSVDPDQLASEGAN